MRANVKSVWLRMGFVVAACLAASPLALAQSGAKPSVLVLQGGVLIDGTGRAPINDAVVVTEGGRIKAVGRRGQVTIPAGAKIINTSGRTILPGLIDSHVHSHEWHPTMFLHYGVTTVADLENDTTWITSIRDAINKGKIKGPRMFVAGRIVSGPLLPNNNWFNIPDVRNVEEARVYTRKLIAAGVDLIKLDYGLTDDQVAAVVEEGNKVGLPVVGHNQNILRDARRGLRQDEHMDSVARSMLDPDEKIKPKNYGDGPAIESQMDPKQFPAAIAELVKYDVLINPTLIGQWSATTPSGAVYAAEAAEVANDPQLAFVPADIRQAWMQPLSVRGGKDSAGYAKVAQFLREFSAAGGKVVVGTDANTGQMVVPGLSEHNEMQCLVEAGLTPMKAIQGATLYNAQMLHKDKDLGTVEPGKIADFAIIEGDPLKDIRVTRNIRMVIKDGQLVDTAYDPKWVNPLPEPYSRLDRNLQPLITEFSPNKAPQGSQTVTLEIQGEKFAPSAIVRFDTVDLPTHFINSKKLTATVDASLLQRPTADYAFYVVNPGIHGTVSQPAYFLVNFKD